MYTKFKKGQRVYDELKGRGIIKDIVEYRCIYPIIVQFDDSKEGETDSYTNDGKRHIDYKIPTLMVEGYTPYDRKNSTMVVEFQNDTGDIHLWITPKNISNAKIQCYNTYDDYVLDLCISDNPREKISIDNPNYVEKNLIDFILGEELIDDNSDKDKVINFFEEKPERKIELLQILNDFYNSGLTKRKNPVEKYVRLIELDRKTRQ